MRVTTSFLELQFLHLCPKKGLTQKLDLASKMRNSFSNAPVSHYAVPRVLVARPIVPKTTYRVEKKKKKLRLLPTLYEVPTLPKKTSSKSKKVSSEKVPDLPPRKIYSKQDNGESHYDIVPRSKKISKQDESHYHVIPAPRKILLKQNHALHEKIDTVQPEPIYEEIEEIEPIYEEIRPYMKKFITESIIDTPPPLPPQNRNPESKKTPKTHGVESSKGCINKSGIIRWKVLIAKKNVNKFYYIEEKNSEKQLINYKK